MASAPASVATAIARSKPEPGLGQRGRREVHGDLPVAATRGPTRSRRPAPGRATRASEASGSPTRVNAGSDGARCASTSTDVPGQPDERDRRAVRPRTIRPPRRGARPARHPGAGSSTAITSMRTDRGCTSCAASHCAASRRTPGQLAGVTASAGCPNAVDRRVLTSTTTSSSPSSATRSSSPSRARQLRSSTSHPRPRTWRCRHVLAVPPHCVLRAHRTTSAAGRCQRRRRAGGARGTRLWTTVASERACGRLGTSRVASCARARPAGEACAAAAGRARPSPAPRR